MLTHAGLNPRARLIVRAKIASRYGAHRPRYACLRRFPNGDMAWVCRSFAAWPWSVDIQNLIGGDVYASSDASKLPG